MHKNIKKGLLILSSLTLTGLAIGGLVIGIVNQNKLNDLLTSKLQPVKIYSTNDIHGRLVESSFGKSAGIQKIAGYLNEQNYDLLLDGGDMIQGQALNDVDQGETMAAIAADMEYDGIAVGNHEFDFGLDNILKISNIPGVNFLSANTRYKQSNETGEVVPGERVFNPSRIVTLEGGLKAGIIGLTTLDTAFKTHPNNVKDVMFTDLVKETEQQINVLEKQGIELIIVVSHVGAVASGGGSTVELAKALPGKIDLIVDGHTQVDYNIPVETPKGTTQIIQTGEYTKSIRETHFNFNSGTGMIENFVSNQIPYEDIINYNADTVPSINNKIEALKIVEGELNNVQIIENAPIITDNTNGRWMERPMPNMVSDANLKAANAVTDVNLHADLAIMNTGGVRVSLPTGELLRRHAFEVLPFGNQLRVVEMSGSTLQQVMEFSISQQGEGAFLSVSDTVKLNVTAQLLDPTPENTPSGVEKVINKNEPIQVNVQVKNDSGTFVNITPEVRYKVALNDFLLAGGDGYKMLNLSIPAVAEDVEVIAEQGDMLLTLIDYLKYLASTEVLQTYWSSTYGINVEPARILISQS